MTRKNCFRHSFGNKPARLDRFIKSSPSIFCWCVTRIGWCVLYSAGYVFSWCICGSLCSHCGPFRYVYNYLTAVRINFKYSSLKWKPCWFFEWFKATLVLNWNEDGMIYRKKSTAQEAVKSTRSGGEIQVNKMVAPSHLNHSKNQHGFHFRLEYLKLIRTAVK